MAEMARPLSSLTSPACSKAPVMAARSKEESLVADLEYQCIVDNTQNRLTSLLHGVLWVGYTLIQNVCNCIVEPFALKTIEYHITFLPVSRVKRNSTQYFFILINYLQFTDVTMKLLTAIDDAWVQLNEFCIERMVPSGCFSHARVIL